MIRAAIVGTGAVAAVHARAVSALRERVALVAAVDVDPGRLKAFAAAHPVPALYLDPAEMLARERPDLVLVCTPPTVHAKLSISALESGAWVLCEKPLCASLAEVDAILDAERRTGRYCAGVSQLRFGSAVQRLAREIRDGVFGRPLLASCESTWYRDDAYYDTAGRARWETGLGGPTLNLGIHAMDVLLALLGDWTEVRAVVSTQARRIEVEDVSLAHLTFAGGALASIVNSVVSPRERTYLRIDLERATVEASYIYKYNDADWTYTYVDGAVAPAAQREVLPSHEMQLAAFLDSMERHERPHVSGDDARRTIELVTAIYKAASTGASVVRGSIRQGDPFYERVYGDLPRNMPRPNAASS